ncbi:SRPBCC domain-containing protein [Nannocystaceae bacterium ST9]
MTRTPRASTIVRIDPHAAFALFTGEIALWWKPTPRRKVGLRGGTLYFEGESSGRLCERLDDQVYEVGRVLAWRPGELLRFEWRAPSFEPGEATEVEVRFEPEGEGTRVSVEHRGWERIPDERLRRGLDDSSFESMLGLWWGDLLTALRWFAGSR